MAGRQKRDVSRPKSYKTFNEQGRKSIPTTPAQPLSLAMHENDGTPEDLDIRDPEMDERNLQILMQLQNQDQESVDAGLDLHINPSDDDLDRDQPHPSTTRSTRSHTRIKQSKNKNSSAIATTIPSATLSLTKQQACINKANKSQITHGGAKPKSNIKTTIPKGKASIKAPVKITRPRTPVAQMITDSVKTKKSATVTGMQSHFLNQTHTNPNLMLVGHTLTTDQREAERQMLIHAQRESSRVQKSSKETNKQNKRAASTKAARRSVNTRNTDNWIVTSEIQNMASRTQANNQSGPLPGNTMHEHASNHDNATNMLQHETPAHEWQQTCIQNTHNDSDSEISFNLERQNNANDDENQNVRFMKNKVFNLNPVRRARNLRYNEDGSNNPNVPGQDNGLNAWLDAQLNGDTLNQEEMSQTVYAKKNSDNNRFFNIDDVPVRGPPLARSRDEIQAIAQHMIDNQSIPICRSTGVRLQEPLNEDRRPPHMRNEQQWQPQQQQQQQQHQQQRQTTQMVRQSQLMDPLQHIPRPRRQPRSTVTQVYNNVPTERYQLHNTSETSIQESLRNVEVQQQNRLLTNQNTNRTHPPYMDEQDIYSDEYDTEVYENPNAQAQFIQPAVLTQQQVQPIDNEYDYDSNNASNNRYQTANYGRSRSPRRRAQDKQQQWMHNLYREQSRAPQQAARPARPSRRRSGQSYDTSSSSDQCERRIGKRKIRSGISAKPSSNVQEQLKYPQFSLGLLPGYIGQNVQYHNLNYEQFLAGEMGTINSTKNYIEREGRLQLLQRVTTWKLRTGVSWPAVRNTYAHILRRIEDREIDWREDWDRYERNIYDRIIIASQKTEKPKIHNTRSTTDATWFCRNYQKPDGCNKDAPHNGRVGNQIRSLQHICATCWLREKIRRSHPECSSDCPHKEQ